MHLGPAQRGKDQVRHDVSGYRGDDPVDRGHARETLESGAAGFIGKPYQLKDLEAGVRKVLDQKR